MADGRVAGSARHQATVNGEDDDALGTPAGGRRWPREHGNEGSLAELALLRTAGEYALGDVVRGESSPSSRLPCTPGFPSRQSSPGPPQRRDYPADSALRQRRVPAFPARPQPCQPSALCSMAVRGNRDKARPPTPNAPGDPVPRAKTHAPTSRHANDQVRCTIRQGPFKITLSSAQPLRSPTPPLPYWSWRIGRRSGAAPGTCRRESPRPRRRRYRRSPLRSRGR